MKKKTTSKVKKVDKRKFNGNKGHSTKTRRVGRPALEVDEESILKLAQVGMTDEEICQLLDISQSLLNNFRGIIQRGRSNLSKSIKRTQLEVALNERDKTMLIWVGKQYAKQRDRQDLEHSGEVSAPQIVFYGSQAPKSFKEDA